MRKVLIMVAAIAMMATALPMGAASAAQPGFSEATPIVVPIPVDDGADVKPIDARFGLNGESRVVVSQERGRSSVGGVTPQFSVGFGWRIYVYLDPTDFTYLMALSTTVATAILCGWLAASGVGAVACAIATTIVGTYLTLQWMPPSGYCREFKFYYGGIFNGTKLVKRSC